METAAGGGRVVAQSAEYILGAGVAGYTLKDGFATNMIDWYRYGESPIPRTALFDRIIFEVGGVPVTGNDISDVLASILVIVLILKGIKWLRGKK